MSLTARRDDARTRSSTSVRFAAAVFAVSALTTVIGKLVLLPSPFTDLIVYQLEGDAVRHGQDLYGPLPGIDLLATYPPFAALLFTATTPMPFAVLKSINLLLTVAAMAWVGVASARLCGLERDRARTVGLVAAAIGLWCEPVLMTLQYGQINIYLLALVLWDFTRPPGSKYRGVALGLAAAIKITPAVFVVYLLLTRRFAMAVKAVITFGVTIVISLIFDVHATFAFWTDHIFDTARVGRPENAVNQTVRGWLVRAHHSREIPSAEMLIIATLAIFGLFVAVRAYRTSGDRWGVPVAAVTGLLCSPIAWSHHWVWVLPIGVLLFVERRYVLLATGAAIFFSFSVWLIPHADHGGTRELHLTWWQVLLSGWYVLFGLVFLVVALRATTERAR